MLFVADFILPLLHTNMMNIKDVISQYANEHNIVTAQDISVERDVNIVTARQYLSSMYRAGNLERVGTGVYSLRHKQEFSYLPSDAVKEIYATLKDDRPFADFCVYDGSIIAPIQHHLSINNAIYVETNRDVVETVFGKLKDGGKDVFRQPDAQFVYDYIDLRKQCIIVKALVSESPTMTVDGIVVPTLEKLLVDIQADADFDYLRGEESQNMFNQAFGLFSINIQRLMRYSRRRNLEQETKSLVDSIKRHDQ
jgi:hypothetical protein